MKLDIIKLYQYYYKGLLTMQVHPSYDLIVWNYTKEAQYTKSWDPLTIMCRGIITDSFGNIIAHCLKKFFNFEELDPNDIPVESMTITEKMDGCFGNIFFYNREWILSSRGSFTSDASIVGNRLLKKINPYKTLDPSLNYNCEIISPETRILVDYGDKEDLVFITGFNVKTGNEVSIKHLVDKDIEVVKEHKNLTTYFDTLKTMIDKNHEGFVVCFKPSNYRLKIKSDEYFILSKNKNKINRKNILFMIRNKTFDNFMDTVPDEFYEEIKNIVEKLNEDYQIIYNYSLLMFNNLMLDKIIDDRKKLSTIVINQEKHIIPILFGLYDKKDVSNYVWNIVEKNLSIL